MRASLRAPHVKLERVHLRQADECPRRIGDDVRIAPGAVIDHGHFDAGNRVLAECFWKKHGASVPSGQRTMDSGLPAT